MRILVTGSRHWTDRFLVARSLGLIELRCPPSRRTLVSGACPTGADRMAEEVADGLGWTVERHRAQWGMFGPAAGPHRNTHMVSLGADLCVAFPLPGSRGTIDCMTKARAAGIQVWVPAETS